MATRLRTNTNTKISVGPFLDKTDGITPEVAITVANTLATLVADTDDNSLPTLILDSVAGSNGTNTLAHITSDDAGYYSYILTASNLNRLGRIRLSFNDVATHCPVFHEFEIVPAVVYDADVLGTDNLDVNAAQWNGLTTVALPLIPTTAGRTLDVASTGEAGIDLDNILFSVAGSPGAGRNAFGMVDVGTVGAAATTTASCDLRAAAAFTTGQLVGATIIFSTGEARSIVTQTNDSITFDALITAPTASTTTYVIFGSAPASTLLPIQANLTQILGTAVATPATAGLLDVNVKQISTDATAADNAELMFDGTGYAGGTTPLQVDAKLVSASAATADNLETAFASTIAELAAIPAANAPLWTALKYLFLLSRNKITQTSTTQLVKADDGSTTVATYTISDDATTYTRGEGA